jgi:hypothetical protein
LLGQHRYIPVPVSLNGARIAFLSESEASVVPDVRWGYWSIAFEGTGEMPA